MKWSGEIGLESSCPFNVKVLVINFLRVPRFDLHLTIVSFRWVFVNNMQKTTWAWLLFILISYVGCNRLPPPLTIPIGKWKTVIVVPSSSLFCGFYEFVCSSSLFPHLILVEYKCRLMIHPFLKTFNFHWYSAEQVFSNVVGKLSFAEFKHMCND